MNDLAHQAPNDADADLERFFLKVREYPQLVGENYFVDQVVAGAAFVASRLPGGKRFRERIQALAAEGRVPDLQFPAAQLNLIESALNAMLVISAPGRQWPTEWVEEKGGEPARLLTRELRVVLATATHRGTGPGGLK